MISEVSCIPRLLVLASLLFVALFGVTLGFNLAVGNLFKVWVSLKTRIRF